jgi:hypothetical protein
VNISRKNKNKKNVSEDFEKRALKKVPEQTLEEQNKVSNKKKDNEAMPELLGDGDYYLTPEGYKCFTEQYHLKRGYCCQSGCRHCPYGYDKKRGSKGK